MAVTAADLKLFKSANNFGGAITATEVSGTNVFGTFSGAETATGRTEFACIYVRNTSGQTAFGAKVWISAETSHGSVNAQMALGNSAINGTETATAGETTAPAPALTFVEAANEASALSIGDLAAGAHKAIWIRLDVPAGTPAKNSYQIEITIKAETGE